MIVLKVLLVFREFKHTSAARAGMGWGNPVYPLYPQRYKLTTEKICKN